MNKKMVLMISAVLLLGTLAVSGTISYMVANTDAEHKVSAGNLNVKLIESENRVAKVVPGERIDYPIKVKNTGDYPLYAKITVKKYWSEANKKNYNGNSSLITLLNKNGDDWIMDDKTDMNNKEVVYFYSRKPIEPNKMSSEFISQVAISENVSVKDRTLNLNVDCTVDAIQNIDVKNAMMAEWGLDVSISDDGILSIENE